jgi:hypothetical protein
MKTLKIKQETHNHTVKKNYSCFFIKQEDIIAFTISTNIGFNFSILFVRCIKWKILEF